MAEAGRPKTTALEALWRSHAVGPGTSIVPREHCPEGRNHERDAIITWTNENGG
jgi:hypothetical protein